MNSIKKLLKSKVFRIIKGEENQASEFLQKFGENFSNAQVVFDIGAYQGNFTKECIRYAPRAEYHLFEPSSTIHAKLIDELGKSQRVIFNQVGISDVQGTVKFHLNKYSETNSLLSSSSVDPVIDKLTEAVGVEVIRVDTIDNYCEAKDILSIDLLKIDIQGCAYQALKGASRLLKNQRIFSIYVELEFVTIYDGQKLFLDVLNLLYENGYQLVRIFNQNFLSSGQIGWADFYFKPKCLC